MSKLRVSKSKLPWWLTGLILAGVQILAVSMVKPLGVSTQFVVVDSRAIHKTAPEYAQRHPLISREKYRKFSYGFWLDVGLVVGALAAAIMIGSWKLRATTVWWRQNYGSSPLLRFIACFIGGFFILLGARLAHGCTSGQFASGWAQLSVSAIPFTIGLFGFGIITAFIFYKNSPDIEK